MVWLIGGVFVWWFGVDVWWCGGVVCWWCWWCGCLVGRLVWWVLGSVDKRWQTNGRLTMFERMCKFCFGEPLATVGKHGDV